MLRELLLRAIAEDNYIPNDCREPEHDESEIASSLTEQNRIYYEEANNIDDFCQYYIANSFLKGRNGFPVDKAIAFKYMRNAAIHGNISAIYGLSYLMKPNTQGADDAEGVENYVKMLKIAAYFDSEYASYTLGFLYSIGFHVQQNYVISLIYLKYSADKNYPPAMVMFADRLRNITKDLLPRNVIDQQIADCIDFLNDETGINKINQKLRETSVSIFHAFEDPKLVETTSLIYYRKVIEDGNISEQQKNTAHKRLAILKNN